MYFPRVIKIKMLSRERKVVKSKHRNCMVNQSICACVLLLLLFALCYITAIIIIKQVWKLDGVKM